MESNIFNTLLYGGISLIIIGLILYGVSCYMVRYYERKEKEINRYIFELRSPLESVTAPPEE